MVVFMVGTCSDELMMSKLRMRCKGCSPMRFTGMPGRAGPERGREEEAEEEGQGEGQEGRRRRRRWGGARR